MIARPDPRMLVAGFFYPLPASRVAWLLNTPVRSLYRAWAQAKARGDLPKVTRPRGGPDSTFLIEEALRRGVH